MCVGEGAKYLAEKVTDMIRGGGGRERKVWPLDYVIKSHC